MTFNPLKYFVSVLLSVCCSCVQTENLLVESHEGGADIILTSDSSETKTEWNGATLIWSKGDCMSMTYTLDGKWSSDLYPSAPLGQTAAKAVFSVKTDLAAGTEGAMSFYGVYPSAAVMTSSAAIPMVDVAVPALQVPSAGTFDPSADILTARSYKSYQALPDEPVHMMWERAVAHAEITLKSLSIPSDETLQYVTLKASDPIAGALRLDLSSGSSSVIADQSDASLLSKTLALDVSGLTLTDGSLNVWAVLIPATITSLEVELMTSKALYRRTLSDCQMTFKKNVRNMLSINMSSADRAIKDDAAALVRSGHPRLFINESDIPTLKANAAGIYSGVYNDMKKRVDNLMNAGIEFPDPLAASGEYNKNHEVAFRAAEAAAIWLISEDETYLNHAKTILKEITEYYQLRVENNLNIAWYVFSQVSALCAYDWIYNDLTPAEREEYGVPLYNVMHEIAWHGKGYRESRYRENTSAPTTGCYGVSILPWYLSLTFYGEGINDARCVEMFRQNYEFHQQMIAHRHKMAGTNGGGASSCPTYSIGFYQSADFNFIHTYRTATGVDISESLGYVLKFMDYLDWVRLPDPDKEGSARDFGMGDSHHSNMRLSYQDANYNICEIVNLYGAKHPELLAQAAQMQKQFSVRRYSDMVPFIRLTHKVFADESMASSVGQDRKSIYFDTMGQLIMRSGDGLNDTYALFVSGGLETNHKHYDNNNFIIYKNGYRALDSGTRPEPGQHLSHYFSRTVAHNCVIIRMPGETMPKYWGSAAPDEEVLPVPNDGGQNDLLASVLKAHVETDDYVYVASDATGAYNSAKASLVMREFVWCAPDIFIVFDRVNSTDPSYPKTWLYHTAAEPVINGKEFSETSQGGKSICRTLLPTDAVYEKIGGPGKQFWSDGRNWPLPADKASTVPDEDWPYLGQWRMEVKPGTAAKNDMFMHIIQVGDESLTALPATTTFDTASETGVEFKYNGKSWRIAFDKTGNYGCKINVN